MSQRSHGNKEAKKPKQVQVRSPRVPPVAGGPHAPPVPTGWPRPGGDKK